MGLTLLGLLIILNSDGNPAGHLLDDDHDMVVVSELSTEPVQRTGSHSENVKCEFYFLQCLMPMIFISICMLNVLGVSCVCCML